MSHDLRISFGDDPRSPQHIDLVGPQQPAGALVAGTPKLAQRVLWLLLTEAGSLPYAPQWGTNLLRQAKSGFWRTTGDVWLSFASARIDLLRQLEALQQPDDPPTERAEDVQLIRLDFWLDRWVLTVELTTQAQSALRLRVPLQPISASEDG